MLPKMKAGTATSVDSPLSQDCKCEHFSVFYLYMFSLTMSREYMDRTFLTGTFFSIFFIFCFGRGHGVHSGPGRTRTWMWLGCFMWNSQVFNKNIILKIIKNMTSIRFSKKFLNSILWFLLLARIITFDFKRNKDYKLTAKEVFLLYWMHV